MTKIPPLTTAETILQSLSVVFLVLVFTVKQSSELIFTTINMW